ncbi:amidohydrolase [Geobacillus thermodenitrificans]|uniref:amidohydrolase family protein n=1 Tax=Geobacillus thermodenitrificans TaxID=33940 RepID=UPI002E1B07D0|nr:amidohydrolase [Geobacillus thermodenitrificans]
MRKYIQNATIVTMDAALGIVQGSILIENGIIQEVFLDPQSMEVSCAEIIDGSSMIVIPGMTNAHYHSYSNLLKGTTSNLPLELWSLFSVAYGYSLDDQDMELAVLLGVIEMIRSGITCCIDHFPHHQRIEAALRAYEQSGMRVGFAPMMHDVPDDCFLSVQLPQNIKKQFHSANQRTIEEIKDIYMSLVKQWHRKNGRISILLGPNAPQRCSSEMLKMCKKLSEDEGLYVHTHLLETKIQKLAGDHQFSKGIIGWLEEHGLVSKKLSAAHSIWLEDSEIAYLVENGVTFVHNPASNMILGSGKAPLNKFLLLDGNVALGTDASNCGISHNMFEIMRLAVMIHRLEETNYEKWPQPEHVFKMATIGGAKALGDDGRRGKIKKGFIADLVLINKNSTVFSGIHDLVSQLVFYENGSDINYVMIDGNWILKDGKITTFCEEEVIKKAQERFEDISERFQHALRLAVEAKPFFEKVIYSCYQP